MLAAVLPVALVAAAAPTVPLPQGLQGHDDENWPMRLMSKTQSETPAFTQRYAALGKMQPGIRRYNMFWGGFEPTPSTATARMCATGYELHPRGAGDMEGFSRFHCYHTAQLRSFDLVFKLDQAIGAQGAAILYSAPAWAIEPNCTGFTFGKDVIKGGCVPRDDTMPDFEDFVNLLASRFSPHLKHYIVWNEVASAGWMDCSPHTPNRAGPGGALLLTDAEFDFWVSKYANLMRRTDRAVAQNQPREGYMIWASNDRLWERPKQRDGQTLHTGVKPFLDRLWPKLGANFSWNLAVHPYDPGNPMDDGEMAPGHYPQAYTFATLDVVVAYQRAQVKRIANLDPDSARGKSLTWLYASEQGWPSPACCDDRIRARNICFAHGLAASLPQVIGVTHNFFQDNPGGSEQGGQDYGLIAGNISGTLSNGTGYPTFDAYNATSPAVWAKSDEHFCCASWKVGCQSIFHFGTFDPIATATGFPPSVVVHGWAWSTDSPKAGQQPVEVTISIDHQPVVAGILANYSRPDLVNVGVAPNANHGFEIGMPPSACKGIQTGRHTISVHAKSSGGAASWELDSSPRCLCDFVPCEC